MGGTEEGEERCGSTMKGEYRYVCFFVCVCICACMHTLHALLYGYISVQSGNELHAKGLK